MTRPEVIDVRALVTVAEVSTSIRGIAAEVVFDHASAGLDLPRSSTVTGSTPSADQRSRPNVGQVDDDTMSRVCPAIAYALGC